MHSKNNYWEIGIHVTPNPACSVIVLRARVMNVKGLKKSCDTMLCYAPYVAGTKPHERYHTHSAQREILYVAEVELGTFIRSLTKSRGAVWWNILSRISQGNWSANYIHVYSIV